MYPFDAKMSGLISHLVLQLLVTSKKLLKFLCPKSVLWRSVEYHSHPVWRQNFPDSVDQDAVRVWFTGCGVGRENRRLVETQV